MSKHNYFGDKYKHEYYDKNLRPIHEGDILKVFHFVGPRRKKYYMYKLVVNENGYLCGCHLEFKDGKTSLESGYGLRGKGGDITILNNSEIVQGYNGGYFDERDKLKLSETLKPKQLTGEK